MRKNIRLVQDLARNVEGIVFDNDGVLTDNTEITGFADGTVLKRRSHYDGQGISFLRAIGIKIAIITGDSGKGAEAITQLVDKWNGLPSVKARKWSEVDLCIGCSGEQKVKVLKVWAESHSILLEDCAAMGDDFVDWQIMHAVGLKAAPCTAVKEIKAIADFVSERPAGNGAVRDFVDFILEAKGIHPASLATS